MKSLFTVIACLWWMASSLASGTVSQSQHDVHHNPSPRLVPSEDLTGATFSNIDSVHVPLVEMAADGTASSSAVSSLVPSLFFWTSDNNNNITNEVEEVPPSTQHEEHQQHHGNMINWNTNNLLSILDEVVASRSDVVAVEEWVKAGRQIVANELKDYVSRIASLYYDANPFHNFEHATHVSKSLNELLRAERSRTNTQPGKQGMQAIRSEPLIQFALGFAALIHDVDHPGVPNGQLVQESSPLALRFDNQSVAEQNSLQVAFAVLQEPGFDALKSAIHHTTEEKHRFHSLVQTAVMATDIFDTVLRKDRQTRWQEAFGPDDTTSGGNNKEAHTRIAMEHLMQVADVAHTMQPRQHCETWNERLFAELKQAFHAGRAAKDPADGWYQGELWFFDNYVTPLAERWQECCESVPLASDDDRIRLFHPESSLVDQARRNRLDWEQSGHKELEAMLRRYHEAR